MKLSKRLRKWKANLTTQTPAEYVLTLRADVNGFADEVKVLEDENAKLRDELAKWERLADGIDLPEYPVTQFKPKDLERENAKLKKAIFALAHCSREGSECDECVMNGWQVEKIRMSDFELCDGIRELLQELDVVEKIVDT